MAAIPESDGRGAHPGAAAFATTHWSVVLAAGDAASSKGSEALETLCRTYWRPLYAYLRRKGTTPHDAQDCVQGFFADLLGRDSLARLDRSKGKFRSFLLGALKHFLANEWDRAKAAKRGGEFAFVSWDDAQLDPKFAGAQSPDLPPDQAYERSWAMTLLDQVLGRLRQSYVETGHAATFDALQVFLTGDKGEVPYAEMAKRLELGESALKMSIQRLRRRFGELLRDEIAHTVSKPEEIDEEIRALFAALRR
jgi:DNA-directed RNA polymerase specialized sigma24 family protein